VHDAGNRLEPDHVAALDRDLRLVEWNDTVVVDRGANGLERCKPLLGLDQHVGAVHDDPIAARLLGSIERKIRGAEDAAPCLRMVGKRGDADASRQFDALATIVHLLSQSVQDVLGPVLDLAP